MSRVLGVETSSQRGSLALVEAGVVVAAVHHHSPSEHAERALPMLGELLASAGWDKRSLERVTVGVGPGSFTGIRIGIALAHGLGLGLGIPTVGVGSLAAVAAAVPLSEPRLRFVVRDARREEFFVAAYDREGEELLGPTVWPRTGLRAALEDWAHGRACVVVGEAIEGLDYVRTAAEGAPDAVQTALLGAKLDPALHPAVPVYARGPGADPQHLKPSPLLLPRQD